jgi:hypothetical protein
MSATTQRQLTAQFRQFWRGRVQDSMAAQPGEKPAPSKGFYYCIRRPKKKATSAQLIARMERRLEASQREARAARNETKIQIARLQREGHELFRKLLGH